MSVTSDLRKGHLFVRRLGVIIQTCSDRLYANEDIPLEDIEVASVIMGEFVDGFHHGKEEDAYFPITKDKNSFSEDIRRFLIEHELGRRIAKMLRRELVLWRKNVREGIEFESMDVNNLINENKTKSILIELNTISNANNAVIVVVVIVVVEDVVVVLW